MGYSGVLHFFDIYKWLGEGSSLDAKPFPPPFFFIFFSGGIDGR